VPGVRPARRIAHVDVLVHKFTKTEPTGQRNRQEEARVGHQAIVVEGHVEPVEAVG
jgi:hypothetical protein